VGSLCGCCRCCLLLLVRWCGGFCIVRASKALAAYVVLVPFLLQGQPHHPAPSIADCQQIMPSQGPVVFATEYPVISLAGPSQPGDAPHNAMVNSLLAQAVREPLPAADNDET